MKIKGKVSESQMNMLRFLKRTNDMLVFCPEGTKARIKNCAFPVDTAYMLVYNGFVELKGTGCDRRYVVSPLGLKTLARIDS